ncbi:MAG: LysM peptidoglycan-binding domain-containing protein, partial [Oscillospiraceae bacterium]|nr:LysM peptidoglycan-binding domain-containing protein [Oscillospiraceae bacterium]
LINYIVDELGGSVTAAQYGTAQGRIKIDAAAPAEEPQNVPEETVPEETVPETETPAETPVQPAPVEQPAPAEPVPAEQSAPAEQPANPAGTYVVVKNDSLWKIAQSFYGTGAKWPVIYEANRDTVKNANQIQIGQILVIPAA